MNETRDKESWESVTKRGETDVKQNHRMENRHERSRVEMMVENRGARHATLILTISLTN